MMNDIEQIRPFYGRRSRQRAGLEKITHALTVGDENILLYFTILIMKNSGGRNSISVSALNEYLSSRDLTILNNAVETIINGQSENLLELINQCCENSLIEFTPYSNAQEILHKINNNVSANSNVIKIINTPLMLSYNGRKIFINENGEYSRTSLYFKNSKIEEANSFNKALSEIGGGEVNDFFTKEKLHALHGHCSGYNSITTLLACINFMDVMTVISEKRPELKDEISDFIHSKNLSYLDLSDDNRIQKFYIKILRDSHEEEAMKVIKNTPQMKQSLESHNENLMQRLYHSTRGENELNDLFISYIIHHLLNMSNGEMDGKVFYQMVNFASNIGGVGDTTRKCQALSMGNIILEKLHFIDNYNYSMPWEWNEHLAIIE